ncbi:MAG: hypothetical protein AB7K71_26895, partial [Polyangiaceae bacterium]
AQWQPVPSEHPDRWISGRCALPCGFSASEAGGSARPVLGSHFLFGTGRDYRSPRFRPEPQCLVLSDSAFGLDGAHRPKHFD